MLRLTPSYLAVVSERGQQAKEKVDNRVLSGMVTLRDYAVGRVIGESLSPLNSAGSGLRPACKSWAESSL